MLAQVDMKGHSSCLIFFWWGKHQADLDFFLLIFKDFKVGFLNVLLRRNGHVLCEMHAPPIYVDWFGAMLYTKVAVVYMNNAKNKKCKKTIPSRFMRVINGIRHANLLCIVPNLTDYPPKGIRKLTSIMMIYVRWLPFFAINDEVPCSSLFFHTKKKRREEEEEEK
jgi:hypothetical protein